MLRVLDLFSGIGGFSLGLERTGGFRTIAFCEIDPYCRRVLTNHWPEVPCYDDVRTLTAERLAADGIIQLVGGAETAEILANSHGKRGCSRFGSEDTRQATDGIIGSCQIGVDVICGGFPCQDISFAGKGAGLAGERSGLWSEIARLAGELRPRFVIVENVSAILGRGLDRVLGDLAALGFDAEWHCIPASAVGAPHRRDRFWLVANSRSEQHEGYRTPLSGTLVAELSASDADCEGEHVRTIDAEVAGTPEPLADANKPQLEIIINGNAGECSSSVGSSGQWSAEPDVGRVAHGVPSRVDRLRALGNAVVPQIPELIGRAILASERAAA